MATPETVRFGDIIVKVTNPDTGLLGAPCGFTGRSLSLTNALGETTVPDCDDADLPMRVLRDVKSQSVGVSGQGLMTPPAFKVWRKLWASGASFAAEVIIDRPLADGGGKFAGDFVIGNLKLDSQAGERVKISIDMQSDGAIPWTDASA